MATVSDGETPKGGYPVHKAALQGRKLLSLCTKSWENKIPNDPDRQTDRWMERKNRIALNLEIK